MQTILICCLALFAIAAARPEEHYTTKFDNVNVEDVLKNKRLLQAYVNCALEKGKCTPEGTELKKHLKDALETRCSKCSETQQMKSRMVIRHLINEESALWALLIEKFDPTNKFSKQYEDELKTLKA